MTATATKQKIPGRVVRIVHRSDDSGWTILSFEPEQAMMFRSSTLSVVGVINPPPLPDEALVLVGQFEQHPRYGEQFKVERVEGREAPTTPEGITAYLASGLFPGIGEATAAYIVTAFGRDTPRIIEEEPERLAEIRGITEERATEIARVWKAQAESRDAITFLCGLGITTNTATKIWEQYGDETISKVQDNPYMLAWDVTGIGFHKADQIAQTMHQYAATDVRRVTAGVLHALKEAGGDGHVYLPIPDLTTRTCELLRVTDNNAVLAVVQSMAAEPSYSGSALVIEEERVYLPWVYAIETRAAILVTNLMVAEPKVKIMPTKINESVDAVQTELNITFTEQQRRAVLAALEHGVSVITGGPGTGKSSILKALTRVLVSDGAQFTLCAPTGRASKRMSETTGEEAVTIHRALEFTPMTMSFSRNEYNPLDTGVVIVDEASMLDLSLFYSLLKAIPSGARLVLVGDVDQLPSVGAGDVLRDLINSGRVNVTRLDTIFRQDHRSKIVTNAHLINSGQMPDTNNDSTDFFFFGAESQLEIGALVTDIVTVRLPEKFPDLDPLNDVQVLSPMYRGDSGVDAINMRLQAALNPPAPGKDEYRSKYRLYRVGDKVMQTRNNYVKGVFNGDIGRIVDIKAADKQLLVDMGDQTAWYEFKELDQLTLAYAITIHKSQGNEYPVAVVVTTTAHYVMLQRTLLYTACTRAKKTAVLVGSRKAIGIAVHNNVSERRCSALAERLNNNA